jgi:hypothetical protein
MDFGETDITRRLLLWLECLKSKIDCKSIKFCRGPVSTGKFRNSRAGSYSSCDWPSQREKHAETSRIAERAEDELIVPKNKSTSVLKWQRTTFVQLGTGQNGMLTA